MDPAARTAIAAVPGVENLVEVGRGGAGIVYRGRQPDLDRDVAVKVMAARGPGDDGVARWRREVSAMARVSNHPNILAVWDGGITSDGLPFLVMPYVTAGSLGDRLRTDGAMPASEVVSLGIKLAGALEAAHAAGVLHRDVKPDNVLLSAYGEPQLSDFGTARLVDTTFTQTGSVRATVAFAAPEVLAGEPYTEAADVYGLGATLHACLRGEAPFVAADGETFVAMAVRLMGEQPPDLRARGVPEAVVEVVEAAMAKDQARRIATAAELRERLERVAAGGAASAHTRRGPTGGAAAALDAGVPTAGAPTVDAPTVVEAAASRPSAPASVSARSAPRPPAPAPHARPPATTSGRRSPRAAAAAAAVAVAVCAALLWLVLPSRDGDRPSADGTPGTTAASPSVTTAAPAATDGDGAAGASADAREQAARRYVAALAAGRFREAYAMTTTGFRAAQPLDGYVRFWAEFESIRIVDGPRAGPDGRSATLTLSLDGHTERYTLTFVGGDGGRLRVDGPRPA